jgi:lipoprotein-releasing system ATP-binding protein
MNALEVTGLTMSFRGGDGGRINVLTGVDLTVRRGEMVAVVGTSGAGKSTLLHCLGALEQPTGGWLRVAGQELAGRSEDELSELRNRSIGFVFQFHHLLRDFTALENVMIPMRIGGTEIREARSRAEVLLSRVGLAGRMHHRPSELSGGEQQRCAVARALSTDPQVLLADEPSGNLDHHNAEMLHGLFSELSHDLELAVVVATHNRALAARADRVLLLADGRLAASRVDEAMV